jgi:sugar phosphate isomerase/epimerase
MARVSHQLGLCSVTFRSLAPPTIVELAASAKIEAIEWGSDRHLPPGEPALAREIARHCSDAGIRVSSYGSYVEAGAATGQAFAPVLASAEALGVGVIRVWAGKRGVGSADTAPEARDAVVGALRGMARDAEAVGIAIALEFHPRTLTDTLASTCALLAEVAHRNLFSYWQPRPGIGLEESLEQLAQLNGKLAHLHVFAWTAESKRLALADQEALWLPCLRRSAEMPMPLAGPRVAMIEFVAGDDPAVFRRDAQTLTRWLAGIDRDVR